MKAIQVHSFGGPERLELSDLPTPTPRAGQVLVRVVAAGVNPVETYLRAGTYPTLPALPWTPGSDAGGIVEAVGDGVIHVSPGDAVYTCRTLTGTYATHTLAEAAQVRRLPPNVEPEVGACVFVPYYTAFQAAFHRARTLPGERVLIHGASGGVGLAALQLLRNSGAEIVASAGSEQGLALLRNQGAHHVVHHRSPGYADLLRDRFPGGFQVILEMLANVNLATDLGLLAPFGRVVVIGNRGEVTINPRLTMGKECDIRGMNLFNATPAELQRTHQAVYHGLATGSLQPVIGHRFPLTDAARAHDQIYAPGALGKILLIP